MPDGKKKKGASTPDERAAKLEEGAAKLDEGAAKLHEGATALHEVAASLSDGSPRRAEATQHPVTATPAAVDPAEVAAIPQGGLGAKARNLKGSLAHTGSRAVGLVKSHPVAALATLGAAAAFIEVEFGVGVLAGVGIAAFLATRPGSETRQQVAARSRAVIDRARAAWAKPIKPVAEQPFATGDGQPSPA